MCFIIHYPYQPDLYWQNLKSVLRSVKMSSVESLRSDGWCHTPRPHAWLTSPGLPLHCSLRPPSLSLSPRTLNLILQAADQQLLTSCSSHPLSKNTLIIDISLSTALVIKRVLNTKNIRISKSLSNTYDRVAPHCIIVEYWGWWCPSCLHWP